jgi:long-chain acyl-CoA synthetase
VSSEAPDHPGRVIARLARHVEVALATVDLTLPQYRVLIHLAEGKHAASGLADKLAVSRPSVTGVVDGLVARGLVRREHDSADRRRVAHELTDAGRLLLAAADAEVQRRMEEIAGYAPAGDPLAALEVWRSALAAYRAACHATHSGVAQ